LSVERETSIAQMKKVVEQLHEDGELTDSAMVRTLDLQLTSIGHYANTDQTDKAVKHMGNFKDFIDMIHQTEKLTEKGAETLHEHADYLIEKWQ